MILRPYQDEAVKFILKDLEKNQRSLCILPTGTGKSVIFKHLIEESLKNNSFNKILILFNRVKLLTDQAKRLGNIPYGIYCGTEGKYDLSQKVTVASIKSIKPEETSFDLIITDEAHNIDDSKGFYFEFFKNQTAKVIGFTATPYRASGYIYGKNKFFTHVCYYKPMSFFVKQNFLVEPIAKQPDFQIDVSKLKVVRGEYRQKDIDEQTLNIKLAQDQVTDAINRMQERKKVVWFCSSIKHAELIDQILKELGENSVCIHSNQTKEQREANHLLFESGSHRHLTFITIVAEGYDYPPIDCIVLMRPTRSPALMVQVIGRGLRPFEDKKDCLVLDYGNVVSTLGPIESPVILIKGKGQKRENIKTQKVCNNCRAYIAPTVAICPHCEYEFPVAAPSKLNLTADQDIDFFKKKELCIEVKDVKIENHLAKSGNKCIKITYLSKNLFDENPVEYFAVSTSWGSGRYLARCAQLGIHEPSVGIRKASKIPRKVFFVKESRYHKIERVEM